MALLVVATFTGALVQAATGFGFAIIAAPVFLAVTGSTSAVPVLVGLHVVQSLLLVPRVWRHVSLRHLVWLGGGALVGCPIGLLLLESISIEALKIGLGTIILGFAAVFLSRERWGRVGHNAAETEFHAAATSLTGFGSGFLTAILVMPGPPLMLYYAIGRWPMEAARGLSLTFFSACYVFVLLLAAGRGVLSASGWADIATLSPIVIVGTIAGLALAGRLSEQHYRTVLLVLMAISGVGSILTAL